MNPGKWRIFVIPIFIITGAFFFPMFRASFDPSSVLTPTTFIFSILTGFFLADATTNYRSLKEFILTENASLSHLYLLTRRENEKRSAKLSDAIDKYMIAQLDYELLDHYEHTRDEFNTIVDIATEFDSNDRAVAALITGNQRIFLLAKRTISNDRWLMLTALVFVITYCLLAKRTGDPVLSFLVGIVLASIQQALKLLHDLDSNTYLAGQLGYLTPQEVFKSIGKLPYYPETALKIGVVTPEKPYRVGKYTNYPQSFEKTIEVVEG